MSSVQSRTFAHDIDLPLQLLIRGKKAARLLKSDSSAAKVRLYGHSAIGRDRRRCNSDLVTQATRAEYFLVVSSSGSSEIG